MATHDYVIDNSTGANVRADINNALAAIVSNNSSSSQPTTRYAYMWWADTTTGILKIRNSANDGWVELLQLDGTLTIENGSASTPGLAFRDDLNTGIYQDTNDELRIATGGTERLSLGGANTVFNETGADVDFRIESDTLTHAFFLQASDGRIGSGTSSPSNSLHIVRSAQNHGIKLERTTSNTGSVTINCSSNGVLALSADNNIQYQSGGSQQHIFFKGSDEIARFDTSRRFLLGKTSGSFQLDIGAGSSSLVRLTNTLESSHGSHDANLVAGGTYYQNLTLQQRSFKVQTFNDSSVVNGFTLTPNQKALFGTYFSETTSGGANCQLQAQGTDHNSSGILVARFANDDGGARLSFLKSRSSSGGGVDKLNSGDTCGSIFWVAANNNDLTNGFMAAISVEADAPQGGADTPGRMRFFTTPDGSSTLQERFRVDSSGRMLLGTSSNGTGLGILQVQEGNSAAVCINGRATNGSYASTVIHSQCDRNTTNSSYSFFAAVITSVQTKFMVRDSGNVLNINGSYGSISDITLKENIEDASSQWDDIKDLKFRKFNFTEASGSSTHKQLGLIAQETETVCPNLVEDTTMEIKGVEGRYKTIKTSVLFMKGMKALQEAMAKIEVLETKVAALEAA